MKIYVILIAMFLLKPLGAQDAYTLETCDTDETLWMVKQILSSAINRD